MCKKRIKLSFNRCLYEIETYSSLHSKVTKAIIFILVVCFAVYLAIVTELAIAFAFISIVIATFFASRSLRLTNESLRLTRNTVRPFLSVQPGTVDTRMTSNEVTLVFKIKNTGAIPGELVVLDLAFFDGDEVITNDNNSKKYPALSEVHVQPIIFPNADYMVTHTINVSIGFGKQTWEEIKNGNVKIRHRMKYKDMNTEYLTIQAEQLDKVKEGYINRRPIPPQYWA